MARGVPCSSRVCACLSRGRMRVPCVPCTAARVVRAALLLGRVQRSVAVSGNARRIVRIYMSACGLLCSWGCRLLPVAGISALRPLRAVRLWTATSEPRIPHPQRGDDSDARPVWVLRT